MSVYGNYSNKLFNDLWNDIAPGFYNYGRISPDVDVDTIPDLKKANEDMIEYIISNQGIGPDSRILDLGCGKGMYTVGIAKRTGCHFVGTDINPKYIEECEELAKTHGVSHQGEFLISHMTGPAAEIKDQTYTHIMVLGAMYYAHGNLKKFLDNLVSCCVKDTKIFIWDFVRNVEWELCKEANRHLKRPHPILTKDNVLDLFKKTGLDLVDFEDATKFIIPGYKIMTRECKKRDPNMEVLTYPLVGEAFMEGLLAYVYYCLKIKS
ncbi:uncharacterized protein LOC134818674 [Bolinopsis microptera]|uniref:uncharacterized protein LOC134818674 n=1 Tax=Bolinopsis microptera TaxID=2820187 RepID=UPI00307AF5EB